MMPFPKFILPLLLTAVLSSCFPDDNNDGPSPDGNISIDLQNYSVNDPNAYTQIKVIPKDTRYTINVVNIPSRVSFIIIQAHSYLYDLTLSYSYQPSPKDRITGTNVGLVYFITKSLTASTVLINSNKFNVTTMIAVTIYPNNAPIPGGCNMVFPTNTAPYLNLTYNSAMITVVGQPSMAPENVRSNSCNSPSSIRYQMYRLYTTELDLSPSTYFDAIKMMLTPTSANSVAQKVSLSSSGQILGVFGAYHGTGSIYTVTVQSKSGVSAYVPIHTFSCDTSHNTDSCQTLSTTFSRIMSGLAMVVGLFLCFTGHANFMLEMFVMGSISGGLVSYILLSMNSQEPSDYSVAAAAIGLAFGGLWFMLWWLVQSPLLSVLIPLLNLGFLIASIINFTGVSDEQLFENDFNYWTIFIAIILTTILIFIMTPRLSSIKSCAIIGAYSLIIPIDIFAGSSMKYIVLNVISRATVDGFEIAKTAPPFQTPDIILTVVWILFAICGFFCQLKVTLGKPPFPPPLHLWTGRSNSEATTPLLSEARFSHYSPGSDNVFHA